MGVGEVDERHFKNDGTREGDSTIKLVLNKR